MQGNYSFLQQDPRFLQQQQALAQLQSQAQQPQQTGYVQPQRTGYIQPQQTSGFLQGQQTGYLPQQQAGFVQSHPPGFVQSQPTGFAAGGMMRPNQAGLNLQPQPSGFGLQPQQTSFGMQSQQTGFGIRSQPTGFPGSTQFNSPNQFGAQQSQNLGLPSSQGHFVSNSTAMGGMTAQPTGYPMGFRGMMPAIGASSQPFLNSFMPATGTQQLIGLTGSNFQPSQMQFAQPSSQFNGMSLQQTFQQQNQQQIGQAEVKVPWKLSSEEKNSYDQIFRAWDQTGSGFIEGKMSTEVFAQSGLPREDLMQIWALADVENRGKLNLAEFHVAMGLIYRRLNGNHIPPNLPPEMVPPSARDLDNSVDFLKDLLKKDSARATGESYGQHTLGPVRSLHGARSSPSLHKDATMYKHDELDSSNTYKSRSRHLDRRSVRHAGEDKTAPNLDDMKRELDRTDDMLQSSRQRDDDDSDLDHELQDLQYRIKRIQDDIEYISTSGRRSEANDQERRKLERELLRLRHEDLSDLETKIDQRDRERRKRSQSLAAQRDKRNNSSRFESDLHSDSNGDDRRRDSYSERGYLRGSYDRDIPSRASARSLKDNTSRSSYRDTPSRASARDTPHDRDDNEQGAKRSPSSPVNNMAKSPPPASTTAPTKTMSAEEKKAFIQAEAQRRIQERLRSLGLGGGGSSTAAGDDNVNSRLEQEKQEAALKASKADEETAEREKQRQIRLEEERLSRIQGEQDLNTKSISATQSAQVELDKSTTDTIAPAEQELLAEEEALLRKREGAILKEKAARIARIKQLEEEEAESRRLEQQFQEKKAMFASRSASSQSTVAKKPPPPPAPRTRVPLSGRTTQLDIQLNTTFSLPPSVTPSSQPASTPTIAIGVAEEPSTVPPPAPQSTFVPAVPPAPPLPQQVSQAFSPPPAPPAPPAPLAPQAALLTSQTKANSTPSTNPFHRLGSSSHETPAASAPGSIPTALSTNNPFFKTAGSAPTNLHSPSPQPAFRPPPRPQDSDDEWDAAKDKDNEEEDSDEEGAATARKARQGLAEALFGGIMPSRPQSAAAHSSNPPAASAPPAAPRVPTIKPSGAPVDRGMLLGDIASGARLRKTKTNDRSGSALAGKIIETEPTSSSQTVLQRHEAQHRRSVDWIGGMAADGMSTMLSSNHQSNLQVHAEEAHLSKPDESPVSEINDDLTDNFDMSRSIRVRSLYAYNALRDEDLSMAENLIIIAHPSKIDEDWLYGTIGTTGGSGTFPKSYVEEIKVTWGKALYNYSPSTLDEVELMENTKVAVVDHSDPDWFKIEDNGKIGLVPGAYIELDS